MTGAKNGARNKKRIRGVGEGNEGIACRQFSETSVRQRTELAIGWDSRILLTCVDQRTQTSEAFKGCLQKRELTKSSVKQLFMITE